MKTSHSCFPQTWVCKPRIPQPVCYRKVSPDQSEMKLYTQSFKPEGGFSQSPYLDFHKIIAHQHVNKPSGSSSTQLFTKEKESTVLKEQTQNPLLFCSTDLFYELLNQLR